MADRPLTSSSSLGEHDGERVSVRGTYWVQDLGGHTLKVPDGSGGYRSVKRIAHVRLTGGDIELGARPDAEMQELDGEAVEATGRLHLPAAADDEEMAASEPLPTLIDVSDVTRVDDS